MASSADIYAFLRTHIQENSAAPSLREIGAQFNISAPAVSKHIRALDNEGLITHTPNITRGISIPAESNSVAIPVCKWKPNNISWGTITDVLRIQENHLPVEKKHIIIATCPAQDYPDTAINEGDLLLISVGENIPGNTIISYDSRTENKTICKRGQSKESSDLQLGTVLVVIRHIQRK